MLVEELGVVEKLPLNETERVASMEHRVIPTRTKPCGICGIAMVLWEKVVAGGNEISRDDPPAESAMARFWRCEENPSHEDPYQGEGG